MGKGGGSSLLGQSHDCRLSAIGLAVDGVALIVGKSLEIIPRSMQAALLKKMLLVFRDIGHLPGLFDVVVLVGA